MTSRYEAETVIRWDDAEKTVYFYTASPVVRRKLTKLGLEEYKRSPGGWFHKCPLQAFRWGLKRRGVSMPFPGRQTSKSSAPHGDKTDTTGGTAGGTA